MAAGDPSGAGDSPFATGAFAPGQDPQAATQLPAGVEGADDTMPEQEVTRRVQLPGGFRRAAPGAVMPAVQDELVASHAAKEQFAAAVTRGAAQDELSAPTLPGWPFVLAFTHVASRSSVNFPVLLSRIAESLRAEGVDFKYTAKKAKCRCFQYNIGSYCKFILRAFRDPEAGAFVLEFQRREGDGGQFHAMYARMLKAFDDLIDMENPVVLTQRDAPTGFTTSIVEDPAPAGKASLELPPPPQAGEQSKERLLSAGQAAAPAEDDEEDPSAVPEDPAPLDAEALQSALRPFVAMLSAPYEESKIEGTQTAAQLASDAATTAALVDMGAVRTLALLMASGAESTTVRTLATIALAEVACHPVGQQALAEMDGLPQAFMDIATASASHGGYAMRRSAVLALQRLAGSGTFMSSFGQAARTAVARALGASQQADGDKLMEPAAEQALRALA